LEGDSFEEGDADSALEEDADLLLDGDGEAELLEAGEDVYDAVEQGSAGSEDAADGAYDESTADEAEAAEAADASADADASDPTEAAPDKVDDPDSECYMALLPPPTWAHDLGLDPPSNRRGRYSYTCRSGSGAVVEVQIRYQAFLIKKVSAQAGKVDKVFHPWGPVPAETWAEVATLVGW
jgi:hypothetical protein